MKYKESDIVVSTNNIDHQEWLEYRREGIGGSDVGAIAGVNKYRSPLEVYLEKVKKRDNAVQNEAMYWGIIMEDVIAREFTKRTEKKVRRKNALLKHKDYPFMRANLDRVIVGEDALLECKTTSAFMEKEWKDEKVPHSYMLQIQHYLAVTGMSKAYIAVLIGGNRLLIKEIDRDDELIEEIIKIEKDFWENHVEVGNPPEIDGSSASTELLRDLYPESEPKEIKLDNTYNDLLKTRNKLQESYKKIEGEISSIDNKIKDSMKECEKASTEEHSVTWRSSERSSFDSRAFKAAYPELYEQFKKTTKSRSFKVGRA